MNFTDYLNYDWATLSKEVFEANHKWWHDLDTGERLVRNPKQLLALVTSEASEGLEGLRKNLDDDHLPHRKMIEVEMADHLIRVLDFVAGTNQDLQHSDEADFDYMASYLDDDASAAIWDLNVALVQTYLAQESYWKSYILLICTFAIKFNLDIMGALSEKMAYNKVRADHQKEARQAQGGKVF